jgi:transposase-like protein
VDRLLADGKSVEEIARHLNVSQPTYYNWRNRYGNMNVNEAKELKALREENAKLKRLVAEKELDLLALKEIAAGNF